MPTCEFKAGRRSETNPQALTCHRVNGMRTLLEQFRGEGWTAKDLLDFFCNSDDQAVIARDCFAC